MMSILFLGNNSIRGQSEYAGSRTVTTAGNVDLSDWIIPVGQNQKYVFKIVVEDVDPQLVFTGVNAWTSPYGRYFPAGYPNLSTYINAQWAPNVLPGSPYAIIQNGIGVVMYEVSRCRPNI
jgi:hypothetical protein